MFQSLIGICGYLNFKREATAKAVISKFQSLIGICGYLNETQLVDFIIWLQVSIPDRDLWLFKRIDFHLPQFQFEIVSIPDRDLWLFKRWLRAQIKANLAFQSLIGICGYLNFWLNAL